MEIEHAITRWPTAFDPERGAEVADAMAASGSLRSLLEGAAGCSPYLHGVILKEAPWLEEALARPADALTGLLRSADPEEMRQDKRRMAALVALLDLGGIWSLEEVTGALTDFADRAVTWSLSAELELLQGRGKLPDAPGLAVIAMGKMGAGELNYSSDIDLICVMEDTGLSADEAGERRSALFRAVRAAMKRLSQVTPAGYVFRTDLRLRPDAAVTPIVVTRSMAEAYYESVGRTWERAAHIKARAAAGDLDAGAAYLSALTPFVWRRHLDFAAVEDAHGILLKIREHKGLSGPITLPGHDMKLGRGGIREIEFYAQTRQLISGGREPSLRQRATREALSALSEGGWVAPDVAATLDGAYVRHRTVEHRLQMLRDAQTHSLPSSAEGMARLAAFMGEEQADLEQMLRDDLEAVHDLTEPFFAPAPPEAVPSLAFGAEVMERWHTYPALRSPRAAELFDRLRPRILSRLSAASEPERALNQFDAFLRGLPAGVQVFSLFDANPQLIDLLADVAAIAPALAEYLGRNASVLDAVLGGSFFATWPGLEALETDLVARLDSEADYEAALDAARAWQKEWHFRIGVHHLRGLIDAHGAGQQYAELAEVVLRALWPRVCGYFAKKHGAAPGQGAAIVAMGSLGAGRLHAASDLDLILIFDGKDVETSDGPRPLATRVYYARLTQALVTALSAPMAQGRLYEVDMRLRPSGRNGPVATSVAAWGAYQREEAWTWEHLALTRARPLAGPEALRKRVERVRCDILRTSRDAAMVAQDVLDMRARVVVARPGEGGLAAKDGAGRLQDLELFAQTLALLAGSDAREVAEQLASATALSLPSLSEVASLQDVLWRLRAASRLIVKPGAPVEGVGAGGIDFILRETGLSSEAALVEYLAMASAAADREITALLAGLAGQSS
ncbi:MAG: glutamine-synthetase adenylyltransferase [Pseudomonadota bacterium]